MLTPHGIALLALGLYWQAMGLVSWATLREARPPRSPAQIWGLRSAAVVMLGVTAACTLLAVWPPVFALRSTLGGAACLAWFLLAQPLGVALCGPAPKRGA
jgi:O-antigen/teichoic acid export membrane protein